MKRISPMLAGIASATVAATVFGAATFVAAAPKAGSPPPPIADYWMDVSTTSGFGAGVTAGSQP